MLSPTLPHDRVDLYDRIAPQYDKLHSRWLRYAGGEAQAALEAAVRAIATPHTRLLDAGCGTGRFARNLMEEGMPADRMTLLDPSEQMLAKCADLPLPKVKARLEELPFQDGEFDIVACAWALETTSSTEAAIAELCRVVSKGGVLCIAFCADVSTGSLASWVMQQALLRRNTGSFLQRDAVAAMIRNCGRFDIRTLPCNGPVAALIARRVDTD